MRRIHERVEALSQVLADKFGVSAEEVAESIYEEFRDDWAVVVVLADGTIGECAVGDKPYCQGVVDKLEEARLSDPNRMFRINVGVSGKHDARAEEMTDVFLLRSDQEMPEPLAAAYPAQAALYETQVR